MAINDLIRQSEFALLNSSVEEMGQHYQNFYKDVLMRLLVLEAGSFSTQSPPFRFNMTTGGTNSASEVSATISDLKTRMHEVECQCAATMVTGSGTSSVLAEVAVIKDRVKEMEHSTGIWFEHRRGNFGLPEEVESWLTKETLPSCGMFWDIFSVLVCMKTKAKTGKDRVDEKHSASRANFTQTR
mmetsp:Transcript_23409/g.35509  ORF Transcript_23409/g.35509 Transcript_23409/m.35509 type:complete len:185 (+) Transcript_23409:1390-1944(+)